MAGAKTLDQPVTRTSPAEPEAAPPEWKKSWARENFESILVALVFALFIRTFVAQAFKIPSKSMEDNLLVGDHLVVNKFAYAPHSPWLEKVMPYRAPQPRDVMVFRFPEDPSRDFIKRVVGVGGDRIEIRSGNVFRNGQAVSEPEVVFKLPVGRMGTAESGRARDTWAERHIPAGHFFVMGDNRLNSEDSRYWGTVAPSLVKGKALLIYWSFDLPDELQGPEVDPAPKPGDRAAVLQYTLLHFFDKSRWSRTFRIVR